MTCPPHPTHASLHLTWIKGGQHDKNTGINTNTNKTKYVAARTSRNTNTQTNRHAKTQSHKTYRSALELEKGVNMIVLVSCPTRLII